MSQKHNTQKNVSSKEGDENGSPPQQLVAGEEALAKNHSSVSAGGGDLSQDIRNFNGGYTTLPQEEPVTADLFIAKRILDSLCLLKPLFDKKTEDLRSSRKSFKGASQEKLVSDNRFCTVIDPKKIAETFLKYIGVKIENPKEKKSQSSKGGFAAFTKTDVKLEEGRKKSSKNPTKVVVPSIDPVCQITSSEDLFCKLFGTEHVPVSSFLDSAVGKKDSEIITDELRSKIWSFLKNPMLETFKDLFTQSGGKSTERHLRNLTVFKCVLSIYFSVSEKAWHNCWKITQVDKHPKQTTGLLSFIYDQAHVGLQENVFPGWWNKEKPTDSSTELDRFQDKQKFFLDIISYLNQTRLFESSRTHEFLYDLAIELLRKLGRDTKRISFDDASSSHAAIVILIFKDLYHNGDESDVKLPVMLVQLFRTMTECFSANNAFLLESMCFDEQRDLSQFRVRITAQSRGLSHNSLLECDLKQFMLNPVEVWKMMNEKKGVFACVSETGSVDLPEPVSETHAKKGVFACVSETGSGKSTILLLLAILQAILSKANVFYVGPETATMNPEYIATIIEVVCQFMESCGRERPVIRLNQSGVAKHESGVMHVFMTTVVGHCLPLLSSVCNEIPSIVIVDDNTRFSPADLKRLFSHFPSVFQLHICGATMDFTNCGNVVHIGGDVVSTVSFCAPTFIDETGSLPMSPDAFRMFLLATKPLRNMATQFFKKCGDISMGFIYFFQKDDNKLAEFSGIITSFAKVKNIPFVELVRLARLLHNGFPAFQTGKVYSVAELSEISLLVHKFITITTRIGFVFEDERLQFPKDLSEADQRKKCEKLVEAIRTGENAPIVLTTAKKAYDFESLLVNISKAVNQPIYSSSSKSGLTKPSDDKEPTGGGEMSESSSEETVEDCAGDGEDEKAQPETSTKKKPKQKQQKKQQKKQKPQKKPNPATNNPVPSSLKDMLSEQNSAQDAVADAERDSNLAYMCDSANDAVVAAIAAAAAAANPDAADATTGNIHLSANDAFFLSAGSAGSAASAASSSTLPDDSHLTLKQILNKIFKANESVGHRSLPQRKAVIEALSILCKSGHPDAARWLHSFIYGVVLLDTIMPTKFIELCLEMFNQGRIIIVLAYELFHLQSWNAKCCLRMKIVVANSVPLWVLRQTMARAGRLGTEHCGELLSWVSCLVLPNPDVSVCETSAVACTSACSEAAADAAANHHGPESVSEERMPLMSGNSVDRCQIESAIMEMLCRGNFSRKHHAFIQEFLQLFHFAYRNPVCHHACLGGRDYFMDFMRFISGVLVSKFVSPINCDIQGVEDRLAELAFTKFRFGVDDVKSAKVSFSKAMLALVGLKSTEVALCLSRATGTKKFVGISHFDLPQLFKDLYENYPDSMTSFLKLIRNLLMNLQTMPLFKCDRTVDATLSAMLLVITTTLDFVGDILSLLADMLRERDMEQFRVGFKPELTPLQKLRDLLNSKAGLPKLQDFGAFLSSYQHALPVIASDFTDVCAFLSPNPYGRFHVLNEKSGLLKVEHADKKREMKVAEQSLAKPMSMSAPQWVKHTKTQAYSALCEEVKARVSQLMAEIRQLEDELASIEKVIGNLPTDLSDVVKYFKKLV
jgi:energy-coupling factor transporter ATP-binding protein EcfA2